MNTMDSGSVATVDSQAETDTTGHQSDWDWPFASPPSEPRNRLSLLSPLPTDMSLFAEFDLLGKRDFSLSTPATDMLLFAMEDESLVSPHPASPYGRAAASNPTAELARMLNCLEGVQAVDEVLPRQPDPQRLSFLTNPQGQDPTSATDATTGIVSSGALNTSVDYRLVSSQCSPVVQSTDFTPAPSNEVCAPYISRSEDAAICDACDHPIRGNPRHPAKMRGFHGVCKNCSEDFSARNKRSLLYIPPNHRLDKILPTEMSCLSFFNCTNCDKERLCSYGVRQHDPICQGCQHRK
jgi:hypothetical protein